MKPNHLLLLTVICAAFGIPPLAAQRGAEAPRVCAGQPALGMPEWARNAVIYEVNVRQYSDSGKLNAVTEDLPRLRELGVSVLWLMPVHPIGEHDRKGTLGSYYAVRDYRAINPEFGTAEDFRRFVDAAHAQGFRVIMDWVANHSAWDNPLSKEHPEYYVRDAKGAFTPPTGTDWSDVIQFDFGNPAVTDYHADAMAYWINEYKVDGFRCDFANGLPTASWEKIAARLRDARPDVFLLAEAELPQQQLKAFNASYSFSMLHTLNAVAQGRACVSHIDDTLARSRVLFPGGAALLYYTSNHDENSWSGSEFERLGGGARAFAALTFMLDGIPLIYNGQEAALEKRLEFFERDPIEWRKHPNAAFYRALCELKKTHPALRTGAPMRRLATTGNDSVYAILRESGGRRVLALLNLTARDTGAIDVHDPALAGAWRELFTGEAATFSAMEAFSLRSWEYRIFVSLE